MVTSHYNFTIRFYYLGFYSAWAIFCMSAVFNKYFWLHHSFKEQPMLIPTYPLPFTDLNQLPSSEQFPRLHHHHFTSHFLKSIHSEQLNCLAPSHFLCSCCFNVPWYAGLPTLFFWPIKPCPKSQFNCYPFSTAFPHLFICKKHFIFLFWNI